MTEINWKGKSSETEHLGFGNVSKNAKYGPGSQKHILYGCCLRAKMCKRADLVLYPVIKSLNIEQLWDSSDIQPSTCVCCRTLTCTSEVKAWLTGVASVTWGWGRGSLCVVGWRSEVYIMLMIWSEGEFTFCCRVNAALILWGNLATSTLIGCWSEAALTNSLRFKFTGVWT